MEAAAALDRPFVITARTDILLYDTDATLADAIDRLQAFAQTGPGCLYAPGVRDIDSIRTVCAEAGGPTNILVPVGSPLRLDDVAAAGARRISIGGSLYNAQVAHAAQLLKDVLATGSFAVDARR